jgi:hypothetical protein
MSLEDQLPEESPQKVIEEGLEKLKKLKPEYDDILRVLEIHHARALTDQNNKPDNHLLLNDVTDLNYF